MKTALAPGAVTVLEWLAEFSLQAEHAIRDIAGAREPGVLRLSVHFTVSS